MKKEYLALLVMNKISESNGIKSRKLVEELFYEYELLN